MHIRLHQRPQRGIHEAMPRERREAGERGAGDPKREMAASVARAGMAGMPMALVDELEPGRLQRRDERRADRVRSLPPRQAHGSTGRNGRTSTRTNTPAARYGSASAHARASPSDGNSATTRLPVNPAGPGSSASSAGSGPASFRRPASASACRRARCAGRAAIRAASAFSRSRPRIMYHTMALSRSSWTMPDRPHAPRMDRLDDLLIIAEVDDGPAVAGHIFARKFGEPLTADFPHHLVGFLRTRDG